MRRGPPAAEARPLANHHDQITPEQLAMIRESRLFFVASAHAGLDPGPQGQGAVNLSPKGNVPLEVIDPNHVAYLDYHGSGNETARHADSGGPVTLMVMSLQAGDAAIVRLYGRATIEPLEESPLAERLLAADPSYSSYRALVKAAARAGDQEVALALVARGVEALPEKRHRSLERAARPPKK